MINTKLVDILPDNVPDEAAFHLVNFMVELSLTLKSHYYNQLMRYDRDREREYSQEDCS